MERARSAVRFAVMAGSRAQAAAIFAVAFSRYLPRYLLRVILRNINPDFSGPSSLHALQLESHMIKYRAFGCGGEV